MRFRVAVKNSEVTLCSLPRASFLFALQSGFEGRLSAGPRSDRLVFVASLPYIASAQTPRGGLCRPASVFLADSRIRARQSAESLEEAMLCVRMCVCDRPPFRRPKPAALPSNFINADGRRQCRCTCPVKKEAWAVTLP